MRSMGQRMLRLRFLASNCDKIRSKSVQQSFRRLPIIYQVKRFDIKDKEQLKTLSKCYVTDTGTRNALMGYSDSDMGRILESVVRFFAIGLRVVPFGCADTLTLNPTAASAKNHAYSYAVSLRG